MVTDDISSSLRLQRDSPYAPALIDQSIVHPLTTSPVRVYLQARRTFCNHKIRGNFFMNIKRFNWQTWAGFLLSVATLISYLFVFVRWPSTRDFPWANLLLFGIAAVFLVLGIRRGFAADRRWYSKLGAAALATLGALVIGVFVFGFFVASRWLPASHAAPQVGQKAPDFTLNDTHSKPVSLSGLLSEPINGKAPRGVLLIYYRGYW